MSVSVSSRTWAAKGGYDGEGWTRRQLDDFGALMEAASVKPRGRPRLVTAWNRSRSCVCWYSAQAGPEEVALRDKCRAIFGARERSRGPVQVHVDARHLGDDRGDELLERVEGGGLVEDDRGGAHGARLLVR